MFRLTKLMIFLVVTVLLRRRGGEHGGMRVFSESEAEWSEGSGMPKFFLHGIEHGCRHSTVSFNCLLSVARDNKQLKVRVWTDFFTFYSLWLS